MTAVPMTQRVAATRVSVGPSAPPAPVEHRDDPERTRVLCTDLLQPYLVDYREFVRLISAEAARYWGRPRMFDLACGTGSISLPILNAVPQLDYCGFDASPAAVRLFRCKAIKAQRLRRTITLTAPLEPWRKDVTPAIYGGTAEMVLLANMLQYVPLAAPSDATYNRVGMLTLARSLIRPGGKLFIIEEVFGETAEQYAQMTAAWNDAFVARVRSDFPQLARAVGLIDPDLRELLGRLLSQPRLAQVIRERLRPAPQRQLLPLGAWCRMFEHLKWRYGVVRHDALANQYLFIIQV